MKKLIENIALNKIILLLLIVVAISCISKGRFQQVIDNAKNSTIRENLIEFEKGGIERKVNTLEYDSDKAIAVAEEYIGTPHKMGGSTDEGIDCSGLIMVVHSKFNIQLPRSSHDQARFGKVIPGKEELKRGDLVFFYNSYTASNFITHSGMYLGEGNFIHTSNSKGVIVSKMDDVYWGERYLFATRLHE